MATMTNLQLRDGRDRLIDFLGFGQTYPLRDLVVRDEQLTVAFNTPAKIPIENSQRGVLYQLHDDGQPAERPPDGNGGSNLPIQLEGNGATIILETYRIQEDITFEIYAQKLRGKYGRPIESGSAAYLHQTATVKVGLDTSLRAWINAPPLDPGIIDPTGAQARVVFYGEQVDVEIENSQEGVDYQLVLVTPTAEEVTLSDIELGDLDNITLRSGPVAEDIEIRIRATKIFDPSEERDTETDLLAVVLPLRVRANPELALTLDPGPVTGYQQPAAVIIGDTQESARYQLFGRAIRDRHYYPNLCQQDEGLEAQWVRVTVPGEEEEVQVCRPPWEPLWTTPQGFVPWGEPLAGNGGELELKLEALEFDHLFIISAQKLHRLNDETEQEIPSQVQLMPAAAILVEPDPHPPLKVQVNMNGQETDGQMVVTDGQPGVFYHFHLDPEGTALGLPAYFHQRDDTDPELNKGLEKLGLEKDFVIGRRSATGSQQADPAAAPPPPPLLETAPLPGGATLSVLAKKAMTRVSVPLTAGASISPLPRIRLQDPIVDYDTATKILVESSLPGDRYEPWLDGRSIKRARLGNEGNLFFNTDPLKEDATFELRVTRPDDKSIPVERVVRLQAIVRPNTRLAVSPVAAVIDHNTATDIQVESSQLGVDYQLMAGGETAGEPLAGNGETLSLPTGPLAAETTFTVRAIKAIHPGITVDLEQAVTVQVRPENEAPGGRGSGVG